VVLRDDFLSDRYYPDRRGEPFLIAGPCVIESEEHALFMAEVIKGVTRSLQLPFYLKRLTIKPTARRFVLSWSRLGGRPAHPKKVKDEVTCPILTPTYTDADVAKVAEVADILQTGVSLPSDRLGRGRSHDRARW